MPHKDPEVRKAYLKKWRQDNHDYVVEFDKNRSKNDFKRRASWRTTYAKNPIKTVDYHRKRLYGITKEEYDAQVKKQKNLCALCGRPETHVQYQTGRLMSLSVDHNHVTGKNRELLCRRCNVGLGTFEDSTDLLIKAVRYLRKHGENNV